jgi:hypothetical protein
MNAKLVGTVIVAFAATTAFAARPQGHSGGHHAVATRSGGGHYSGVRSSGGRSGVPHVSGGHAVPRRAPGVGRPGLSYAQRRHPRAGYGSGAWYGGRGRVYYGRGYHRYGYSPYYRYYPSYGYYYPSYGYYPYYGYYYPGFSVGLYYGNGYGYYPPYYAPYYGNSGDPAAGSYPPEAQPGDESVSGSDSASEQARVGETGEIQLDVQPDDASVYVDDQFFGLARQLQTLRLPPGPHRLEVVRPGFRTAERTVQVGPDAPVHVVIDLVRP